MTRTYDVDDVLQMIDNAIMSQAHAPERATVPDWSSKSTRDYGQIANMAMPEGWVPGERVNNIVGNSSFRQFHPKNSPEARLCFYYRGRRIAQSAGTRFLQLLSKEPHLLNAKEIAEVAAVLRDKAHAGFKLFKAKTERINGKMVLIVEGRFVEIQQDARCMFIDTDGSGTAIQELYFQAPSSKYLSYAGQARQAMESILWKEESLQSKSAEISG